MRALPHLGPLLLLFMAGVNGEDHFNEFLEDVILEWKLRSPTIVVQEDFPDLCITSQLVLCVSSNELSKHT